jgi:hypothetical protein
LAIVSVHWVPAQAIAAEGITELPASPIAVAVANGRATTEILLQFAAVNGNAGRPERLAGSEADPAHDEEYEERGKTAAG